MRKYGISKFSSLLPKIYVKDINKTIFILAVSDFGNMFCGRLQYNDKKHISLNKLNIQSENMPLVELSYYSMDSLKDLTKELIKFVKSCNKSKNYAVDNTGLIKLIKKHKKSPMSCFYDDSVDNMFLSVISMLRAEIDDPLFMSRYSPYCQLNDDDPEYFDEYIFINELEKAITHSKVPLMQDAENRIAIKFLVNQFFRELIIVKPQIKTYHQRKKRIYDYPDGDIF